MIVSFEIRLTIPDNEARTALATLQRLGVEVDALERATLYRADVDDDRAAGLEAVLRSCEPIFNPNKHALAVRAGDDPLAGEVWIDEPSSRRPSGPIAVGGRSLAGVRRFERYVAWRLFTQGGEPARREIVEEATRALLCNPAFERATFEDPAAP